MFRLLGPARVALDNKAIISRTYISYNERWRKMIAGPVPALVAKNVTTGKFKWERPTRMYILRGDKSGDCSDFPDIDKNLLAVEFQQSKELET